MSVVRSGASVVVAGLVLSMSCGCGASTGVYSAAPPWKVCGQVVYNDPSGAAPVDVSQWPNGVPITELNAGDSLALLLSDNCSTGMNVAFSPPKSAKILKSATVNGALLAAVIAPHQKKFAIRLTNEQGTVRVLRVHF